MTKKQKILELDGKPAAVCFCPSKKGERPLQVWGVVHVTSKRPLFAYIRSFKSGSTYLLDLPNVEFVGEMICKPYEIDY